MKADNKIGTYLLISVMSMSLTLVKKYKYIHTKILHLNETHVLPRTIKNLGKIVILILKSQICLYLH